MRTTFHGDRGLINVWADIVDPYYRDMAPGAVVELEEDGLQFTIPFAEWPKPGPTKEVEKWKYERSHGQRWRLIKLSPHSIE